MKKIGQFLNRKNLAKPTLIDEKTVFFIFKSLVKVEYGNQGTVNIQPHYFNDKKLFIKVGNENWSNEIYLNKGLIIQKINQELGIKAVDDLVIV